MKPYFRNFILSALSVLWAVGAQASPVPAPGVYTESVHRYEFDVTGSDLYRADETYYYVDGGAARIVDDPALTQTIADLMHPLRGAKGQTGRIVLEMSNMIEYFEDPWVPAPYLDDRQWVDVDCLSGFLCDLGYLDPQYRLHSSSGATGFLLAQPDIYWGASFDGAGGGTMAYSGDDYHSGTSVVIDGVRYYPRSDGDALFQLGNVSATRLGMLQAPDPIPTPLPAPLLMLISALGGAMLLRRRAGCAGV